MRQEDREVYGEGFERARSVALSRNPTCQFCGLCESTQAHHWNQAYPPDDSVTSNNLTAVCVYCHEIATAMRKHYKKSHHRDKWFHMLQALKVALHEGSLLQLMDLTGAQADEAASEAMFTRNKTCQICGCYRAQYAHSWLSEGSSPERNAGFDELTAFCSHCLNAAAAVRGYYVKRGKPLSIRHKLESALRRYPLYDQPLKKRIRSRRIARDIQ